MNRFKPSLLLLLLLLLFRVVPLAAEPIGMGEPFPMVELPVPVQAGASAYLGLEEQSRFTVQQVGAEVVLVEMLNVLCPHCRKQTKPYNRLFRMIEADPLTRGRIKLIGVAVANSDDQIADFVEIYEVAFPVAADRRFALHEAIRGGPTPFSIYLLQDKAGGPGVVAGSHLGEDDDMEALFAYLKELLDMQVADFAGLADPSITAASATPPLPMSRAELETDIRRQLLERFGSVEALHRRELEGGKELYVANVSVQGRTETLFVRVVSRSAICDVCHDVHFYYVFDRQGTVVAFVPLHLTKYGNVEWSQEDVAGFAARVVGMQLDGDWTFQPEVDAVSSATMTSAIIYNGLAADRELIERLQEQPAEGDESRGMPPDK